MSRKTSEDARRETLELLRSRPRQSDTPFLTSHLVFQPETLVAGVTQFIELARKLIGTNRYVEEWEQARNASEQDAGTGLDILSKPQDFIDFLQSKGNNNSRFSISTTAFSDAIPIEDAKYFTASLGYSGGLVHDMNNRLTFSGRNNLPPFERTLNLQEWVNVVSTIVEWRQPLYISIGSRNYPIHDAVFDHRAWRGWMGWFPEPIDPRHLPSFALTFNIGEGTLVATQDTNVITTDPAQVERAKEVEIALVQLGVLPTSDYLTGRLSQ